MPNSRAINLPPFDSWAVYHDSDDGLPFLTFDESEAKIWQRLGYEVARVTVSAAAPYSLQNLEILAGAERAPQQGAASS